MTKFKGVDLPNPRALRYLVTAHRRGEIGWPAFGVGVVLVCYIRSGDHELVRTADLATLAGLAGLARIPLAKIPGVLKELENAGFLLRGEDSGKWRATNPGHWRAGFHVSALYSPWLSWVEVAKQHEAAEGDPVKMQVFVNTILGLPWEEDSETIAEEFLKRRIEPYAAQVPRGVLVLTMAVDNQGDRLEYEVKGWGEGEESWGIEYGVIPGDPSVLASGNPDHPSVWEQLDERRRRIFRHEDGGEIRISCTFIDSGGGFTDIVYQYTKARFRERVYSVKGGSQPGRPLLNRPIRGGKVRAWLYVLGVNKGKDLVFARLKIDKPGPGYCHFPDDENLGYDGRYYAGLISERKRVVVRGGVKVVRWVLPNKARNEPFDISVYNTAAIRMLDPNWERLRAQRANAKGLSSAVAMPKPAPASAAAKAGPSVREYITPLRKPVNGIQLTPANGVQLIEV